MKRNIGIVCEGPTDYILLKGIIDTITQTEKFYLQLQPEDDLSGAYGNGWKGVWKWCVDHSGHLTTYMNAVAPALDLIVIQLDGDVSRKEKEVHCQCGAVTCIHKADTDIGQDLLSPLNCPFLKTHDCPIILPCPLHDEQAAGFIDHLTDSIKLWLNNCSPVCIAIPCDSTDTWVAAAYDRSADVETIEDPWNTIISRGKTYHGIRIPGHKKRSAVYQQFVSHVCENWDFVTQLCISAKIFEERMEESILHKSPEKV